MPLDNFFSDRVLDGARHEVYPFVVLSIIPLLRITPAVSAVARSADTDRTHLAHLYWIARMFCQESAIVPAFCPALWTAFCPALWTAFCPTPKTGIKKPGSIADPGFS